MAAPFSLTSLGIHCLSLVRKTRGVAGKGDQAAVWVDDGHDWGDYGWFTPALKQGIGSPSLCPPPIHIRVPQLGHWKGEALGGHCVGLMHSSEVPQGSV